MGITPQVTRTDVPTGLTFQPKIMAGAMSNLTQLAVLAARRLRPLCLLLCIWPLTQLAVLAARRLFLPFAFSFAFGF